MFDFLFPKGEFLIKKQKGNMKIVPVKSAMGIALLWTKSWGTKFDNSIPLNKLGELNTGEQILSKLYLLEMISAKS